jgi:hypothetical protein
MYARADQTWELLRPCVDPRATVRHDPCSAPVRSFAPPPTRRPRVTGVETGASSGAGDHEDGRLGRTTGNGNRRIARAVSLLDRRRPPGSASPKSPTRRESRTILRRTGQAPPHDQSVGRRPRRFRATACRDVCPSASQHRRRRRGVPVEPAQPLQVFGHVGERGQRRLCPVGVLV